MSINNLQAVLNSKEFLAIPSSISDINQALDMIVPKGFESFIQSFTDGFDIHLQLLDEKVYNRKVEIKNKVFDLDTNNLFYPQFLFTDLKNKEFVLNQNQVLHLMLLHRFNQFKVMDRPFLNLITKDIETIVRYVRYDSPKSYNDKLKVSSGTVVMYYSKMNSLITDFPMMFATNSMDEAKWKTFLSTHNLALSSVGSMSKTNTVVLKQSDAQAYRAPAYFETKEGFYSIFKSGQNVPARFQSHVINSAYQVHNYDQSIMQQDNLVKDGKLVPKDKTFKEVIVVFHPFDEDRFIAGEGEISKNLAQTLIEVSINIEDCFLELKVEEGKTYDASNVKDYVLGTSLLDEDVTISDFKEFTVNSIKSTGINGSVRLNITGIKQAGNARIVSNTGLKSVTKVVPNLGTIVFDTKPDRQFVEDNSVDAFANGLQKSIDNFSTGVKEIKELTPSEVIQERYPWIDINTLDEYPGKELEDVNTLTVQPDLIIGMNSTKGKSNSIVLAQACLAVKLGYYVPKEKHGFKDLLDTLNEKEINEAAKSLPNFTYTDKFGKEVKVHIGLAYIQFTELCSTYTKFKDQSFSFESGRVLATDNEDSKKLFDYIWGRYLEQDKLEASKELFKIYMSASTSTFNNDDNLPVYNLKELNEIFTQTDLVLTTVNQFPSDSLLLDEDWNKGFFIDLSKYENAPVIRIPSAKTLKLFSGVLKNGDTIYHTNLVNVSKIISGCLKTETGAYRLNTVYAKDKSRDTPALAFNRYMANVKSTLFSSEDESQRLIQSFIKPKIPGTSFKQVVEKLLPNNVVLFCCDKTYNKIKKESLKGSEQTITENDVLIMLLLKQIQDSDDINLQKELFRQLNEECPLMLCVRSPSLWKGQNIKVRVWDRTMFELYLKLYKGLNIDQVLDTYYNRDIMLSNYEICRQSRSDNDGDLLPGFVLDYQGQQVLKDFKLTGITKAEQDWYDEYKASEMSSDSELHQDHKFKLYFVTNEEYNKYIQNAVVCKGLTGNATLGIWTFSTLLNLYKAYWETNKGLYIKKDRKIPLVQITNPEIARLEFEFIRLTQELVINGIKHVQNGSADFAPYALNNIGDKKYEKLVRHQLLTKYGLPSQLIDKLFFIIRFAQDNKDMLKACQNFFSLYNKGRFPVDSTALDHWSNDIVEHTHFGSQLKELFEIKQQFENTMIDEEQFLSELLNSDTLSGLASSEGTGSNLDFSQVVVNYQL